MGIFNIIHRLLKYLGYGLSCITICSLADEMYVLSASDKRVSVQFVGKDIIKDKLSRFEELTSVSLSYMGVSSLGNPCQIGSVLPSKFVALLSS